MHRNTPPKNLLSLVNGHYKFNLKAYLAWSQVKGAWMLELELIELDKKKLNEQNSPARKLSAL